MASLTSRLRKIVGHTASAAALILRCNDSGVLLSQLMALDTQTTSLPIQVACDEDGKLYVAGDFTANIGDIEVAVDDVEQYILDMQIHYKIANMDTGNATYDYFGFLDKGGNYYIMRQDKTGGDSAFLYSSGASGYAAAWTGRAGESYAIFSTEF